MIMILVIVMYPKANYWGEREIHTNTDYSVTVWMLCVIPHIHNYVIYDYDGNNGNQVKTFIIVYFYGLSYDKMHVNIDLFWGEYI